MRRATKFVALGYTAWIFVCLLIAALNIGDGAVAAHVALLFTGPPASLVSLYAPNGTLLAALAAGVLGLVQWTTLVEVLCRWNAHRGA
jgi:hypothetical protein